MKIKQVVLLLSVTGFIALQTIEAGEILGHISDETEALNSSPETPKKDDRRIIYRVICTPGGEQLPDCERSVSDMESRQLDTSKQSDPPVPEADNKK